MTVQSAFGTCESIADRGTSAALLHLPPGEPEGSSDPIEGLSRVRVTSTKPGRNPTQATTIRAAHVCESSGGLHADAEDVRDLLVNRGGLVLDPEVARTSTQDAGQSTAGGAAEPYEALNARMAFASSEPADFLST